MINLKPIHPKIQKRLTEKSWVLGNDNPPPPNMSKDEDALSRDKMLTRTTFIRLTSVQHHPVILMGGELRPSEFDTADSSGFATNISQYSQAKTFDDIYGARIIPSPEDGKTYDPKSYDNFSEYVDADNKLSRPIAGVKSLDVSFMGGARSHRKATINWTCWSWGELNRLMPHFLAHGKTAIVEFGWVYDTKSLSKLPEFITVDSNGIIKIKDANPYKDYSKKVIDSKGDFDMMVGRISNFEFNSRNDGGFDCQTQLTSVGVALIDATQPTDSIKDPSITYNMSLNDTKNPNDLKKKLEQVVASGVDFDFNKKGKERNPILQSNTNLTFKAFLKEMDKYIITQMPQSTKGKNWSMKSSKINQKDPKPKLVFKHMNNKFLVMQSTTGQIVNAWVTWGWFEDNVLSKFVSLSSADTKTILTEFRSIEGSNSVRIKNSPSLETTNINRYILPGQLRPFSGKKVGGLVLEGDKEFLHTSASIVNDKSTFDLFTVGEGGTYKERRMKKVQKMLEEGKIKGDDVAYEMSGMEGTDIAEQEKEEFGFVQSENNIEVEEQGYLRNILINTKTLRQAFGVDDTDSFTVESLSIFEGINSFISLMNQDIDFWDFELSVDSQFDNRVKIVDKQITAFNFKKSVRDQTSEINENGDVIKPGIFFFPVWKTNSIVKNQNLTARIPNAMALATMYGANFDQISEFSNPGNAFNDKEGLAAAGLWNTYAEGSPLQGIGLAFRTTPDIGAKSAEEPLTIDGGKEDKIVEYMSRKSVQGRVEKAYREKIKKLNQKLKVSQAVTKFNEDFPDFDASVPPPLPDKITDEQISTILQWESKFNEGALKGFDTPITDLLNSKFFDDGEMKPPFKSSITYKSTEHGVSKKTNTPLLIPLDLELQIDGTGGLYPGNSYHSDFVPQVYQEKTLFRMFDVSHTIDSSGWTTTIGGKMQSTLGQIFDRWKTIPELELEKFQQLINKAFRGHQEQQKQEEQWYEDNPIESTYSGRRSDKNVRSYQKQRDKANKKTQAYQENRAKQNNQNRSYQNDRGTSRSLGTNRSGRQSNR